MKNEEKILSMLDLIATELQIVKNEAITKNEFRDFTQKVDLRFNKLEEKVTALDLRLERLEQKVGSLEQNVGSLEQKVGSLEHKVGSLEQKVGTLEQKITTMEQRVTVIEENMVTKEDLHKAFAEFEKDIKKTLTTITDSVNNRNEILEAKFDVLNSRLFAQEAQLQILKEKIAL